MNQSTFGKYDELAGQSENMITYFSKFVILYHKLFGAHKPKDDNGEDINVVGADIRDAEGKEQVEVKYQRNYLTRDNFQKYSLEGTIEFELFQDWKPNNRNDMIPRWLPGMLDPENYTALRHQRFLDGKELTDVKAVTPTVLICVLLREPEIERGQQGKPKRDKEGKVVTKERISNQCFACIAFENFEALKKRLLELCPEPDKWGLNGIDKQEPATEYEYWNKRIKWNDEYGAVYRNCWHVPFSKLEDIATVTMINDNPKPEQERSIRREIQSMSQINTETIQERLSRLEAASKRRPEPCRIYLEPIWKVMLDGTWENLEKLTYGEVKYWTWGEIKENQRKRIEKEKEFGWQNELWRESHNGENSPQWIEYMERRRTEGIIFDEGTEQQ